MRVKFPQGVKDMHTLWWEDGVVKMINQPLLPHKLEIVELKDYQECAKAITTMIVRGAPAIGATGAFGLAQAANSFRGEDASEFKKQVDEAKDYLSQARPTAYDLFHGLDFVYSGIKQGKTVEEMKENALSFAQRYADESAKRCRMIGVNGAKLIKEGMRILTHCNAGALGCIDYGTALAPMRIARDEGKSINVWVDETRPRGQGARLTAWELSQEDIPYQVIADNAAGYVMQKGLVDLVIVGTDRTTGNGDVANKIGTYEKAVLAKTHGIPFYVAAPSSTIDFSLTAGKDIPIEERGEEEVLFTWGQDDEGKFRRVRTAPSDARAFNPSFDVTPAEYVTGIITEKGVFKPGELDKLK